MPRICPSGYVCEFTGTSIADNPCPEGHFCLEGTATSATTCGHPTPSAGLFPILSHAERQSTIRAKRIADGLELYLGSRKSGCWANQTDDFGLQSSEYPARFWSERHLLPLSSDAHFNPIRGRFCLDDSCQRLFDADNVLVTDYAFDYSSSSYTLRRPIPCPPGVYCHPGTGERGVSIHDFSTPQPCTESMYCPEGSSFPVGKGECPKGFYCPFGKRLACPVGTYCGREGHWEPSPCLPGTFNGQVGSFECTPCDRGYVCPGYGRIGPALCPSGYICSKTGLASPDNLCLAGYYCLNGTATADPLRNDTTRRPYPCSPGTYCLSGVGNNSVRKGDFFYAQPCKAGFYCESASATAKGSGECPQGFICPAGTATPVPAPVGSYAELKGLSVASGCQPGYYAPTIESTVCYPCPPGTTCEEGGTIIADLCPPGTYRGALETDYISCVPCPQGTWSKQYGLREAGECLSCPTGSSCPVEGMTTPCTSEDLRTPYEPIINYLGSPALEYKYQTDDLTVYYNVVDCLDLNPGYSEGTFVATNQEYFFGELIPPYIDILGRGPYFRATDSSNLKFQKRAKCYVNKQRYGSPLYQRLTEYYGPSYEIQNDDSSNGYGIFSPNGSYFYDGFFGSGSMFIDLPVARKFESSFNCTKGFALMNASQILINSAGLTENVYTDPEQNDGANVLIKRGVDVFYPGTCEADRVCYSAASPASSFHAASCAPGYVCDEKTTAVESIYYPCRAGYVCGAGSTPDPNIESVLGQFKRLCPPGYYCRDGTGFGEQYSFICPANYFCPTGTGDPLIGTIANDALNRGLSASEANPFIDLRHIRYLENDDVRAVSTHDALCFEGVDVELDEQHKVFWLPEGQNLSNPYVDFLREARPDKRPYSNDARLTGHADSLYYRPSVINSALDSDIKCARDHKWRLVEKAVARRECDCVSFFVVIIAAYRLWRCSSDGVLDSLGKGAVSSLLPFHGGRSYWFPRESADSKQCTFASSVNVTLTTGAVLESALYHSIGSRSIGLLNLTDGLDIQFSWTKTQLFTSYDDMKTQVYEEWRSQYTQITLGNRTSIDPFVFNIYRAVGLIEEFGGDLESLVWLEDAMDKDGGLQKAPGRLDVCECQNLYKCPNGTVSSLASSSSGSCTVLNTEVLRRLDTIPSWLNSSSRQLVGKLSNSSDFSELTGFGSLDHRLSTIKLLALDVAVVTLDLSSLLYNFTYGFDYRISAYVDCKPCPTRYQCDYSKSVPTCSSPSFAMQNQSFYECLNTYAVKSCLGKNSTYVDCKNSTGEVVVEFEEPDLYKCQQIPFFCNDQPFPKLVWNVRSNATSYPYDSSVQESSWFKQDPAYKPIEPETLMPGCCKCESNWMPHYFYDTRADPGQRDSKHGFVQLTFQALDAIDLTVALELLNGDAYMDFDANMIDVGDLFVHTPSRADYTPTKNTRAAFLAIITQDLFSSLKLPLNLPVELRRKTGAAVGGGAGTYNFKFANKVLLGRNSDIYQGDPGYATRFENRKRQLYLAYLDGFDNSTGLNATSFADFAKIPDVKKISSELYAIPDPLSKIEHESSTFWGYDESNLGFLGLPYFPYFSNCKGSDSYISISKLFETDPQCPTIPYDNTVPVTPYPWDGSTVPYSDECLVPTPRDRIVKQVGNETISWMGDLSGAIFECLLEESIDVPPVPETFRWYEAPLGTTLFYLTNTPIPPADYEPRSTTNIDGSKTYSSYWGQGFAVQSMIGDPSKALPVNVGDLSGTYNGGQGMVVPRQVLLQIRYYQYNQGRKLLVSGNIEFLSDFECHSLTGGSLSQQSLEASGIPQCITDINGKIATKEYQLEVRYIPLRWYALLNAFQFTPGIYILFFLLAGVMTVLSAILVYVLNRLLTRLRFPPLFHGVPLLYAIAMPAVFGCSLSGGSIFVAVALVWKWLTPAALGGIFCSTNLTDPDLISPFCFENIPGSWQGLGDQDQWRNGRKGVALISIGVCVVFLGARILNPVWTEEQRRPDNYKEAPQAQVRNVYAVADEDAPPPSRVFRPHIWKRANFMWMVGFMVTALMIHLEFSYSNAFNLNTNSFILVFKVLYFMLEKFLLDVTLGESLLIVPLMGAADVVSDIVTMGAPNFISFLLSYVAQNIVLKILEILYAVHAATEVIELVPRWMLVLRRRFRKNKRMTREMKAKEEMEWRRINEEIELKREGIEPLLDCLGDYSVQNICVMINPLCYAIITMFYTECQIASSYGILLNQIAFFTGFPGFIIPFKFVTDMFLLNTLELIYGWKVYDYISYMQYRFNVREHRWILRNIILDESISEGMQTMDLMCFSSQFYFICGFVAFGIVLCIIGISILERQQFNPFGDPVTPVIIALMIILCYLLRLVYIFLADIKVRRLGWRGLWVTRQVEGTIDDDVAAKLAVGLGRQADLEKERLELQALNSDRFRHKFLERNRPWILQHLVELLTPRSLERPGADGRPTVEYVRDVYAELLAMGDGKHRPGDNADISEDEEDELEAARRNWSRKALSGASLAIARLWLAKARKRRAFSKLIRGVIDQHKKANCDICGRNPEQHGVKLLAFLATDGNPDTYAIDRLIAMFEDQYGVNEIDPILWKAYFRAHAEYCTRCSICLQTAESSPAAKGGEPRITRPQDISSDEDDDEIPFEPVVVSRASNEGKMMGKWLAAARKKLGGEFPRSDARKQMDRYVHKLKKLKLKKARDATMRDGSVGEKDAKKEAGLSAATKALAIRWMRNARDNLTNKFRGKTDKLKEDLDDVLVEIKEEDDWYYGGAMRLEGAGLVLKGAALEDDRRALEAEAAVKIHKIEDDANSYVNKEEAELAKERSAFEAKLAQTNDKIDREIEARANSLTKAKEEKKAELLAVERNAKLTFGALSSAMVQSHASILAELDSAMVSERSTAEQSRSRQIGESRSIYDGMAKIREDEISRRKLAASDACARIRLELTAKLKVSESAWQVSAAKWLSLAKRKVEVKKREDAEALQTKKRRKGG